MGRKRHLGKDRPRDTNQERRAAALAALRAFQRKGRDPDELTDLLTDESDRGAIILVGTWVEDLLADRIIEQLPRGEEFAGELLKQGGVLHSFYDKLVMAQALGVIDAETAEDLEVLRQMRNACAHSRRWIDWHTPELVAAFRLFFGEEVEKEMGDASGPIFQALFNFVSISLFEILTGSTKEQANRTFGRLWEGYKAEIFEAAERHKASLEKRRARSKKADPQKNRTSATRKRQPRSSPE